MLEKEVSESEPNYNLRTVNINVAEETNEETVEDKENIDKILEKLDRMKPLLIFVREEIDLEILNKIPEIKVQQVI